MFQFVSFAWKPYQFQLQSRPYLKDSIFAMNFLFLFAIFSPIAICFFLPFAIYFFPLCKPFLILLTVIPSFSIQFLSHFQLQFFLIFNFNSFSFSASILSHFQLQFFLIFNFNSFSSCNLFLSLYAGHFLFVLTVHTIRLFISFLSHFSFHFFHVLQLYSSTFLQFIYFSISSSFLSLFSIEILLDLFNLPFSAKLLIVVD